MKGLLPDWLDGWQEAGRLPLATAAAICLAYAFAQEPVAHGIELDMGRLFGLAVAAVEGADPSEAIAIGTRAVLTELRWNPTASRQETH